MDIVKQVCEELNLSKEQRFILESALLDTCEQSVEEEEQQPQPQLYKGRDLQKEWLELYKRIQG